MKKLLFSLVVMFLATSINMQQRNQLRPGEDASYDYLYDEIPSSKMMPQKPPPLLSAPPSLLPDRPYRPPPIPDRPRQPVFQTRGGPSIEEPRTISPTSPSRPHSQFLFITAAPELSGIKPEEFDYCTLPCKNHVACKDIFVPREPGCPEQPEYNDMSEFKDFIVDYHNKVRNEVAGGGIPHLHSATRMGTMRWDDGLHYTATVKAHTCSGRHDNCHGTEKFKYSGQNTGIYSYIGDVERVPLPYIIESRLEMWANGSQECTKEIIEDFPASDPKNVPDVGLFTIMVRESNTHIGCGILRYEMVHSHVRVVFVCHYATNNFIKAPTYKEGPPASDCRTGANPMYPNLCSVDELYSYEQF